MEREKKERLESCGWTVGTAADFITLEPEEARLIDRKARLAAALAQLREKRHQT